MTSSDLPDLPASQAASEHEAAVEPANFPSPDAVNAPKPSWRSELVREWTSMAGIKTIEEILEGLCDAFNNCPFMAHTRMKFRVDQGQIKGYFSQAPHLIGNTAFGILHGGVAAAMLDSIGGVVAMGEIYRQGHGTVVERTKQVARLATVDLRIDYIAPGRSKEYVATAEVLRMGRKGCTCRMNLHDEKNKLIATAIGSFAY